MKIKLVIFFCCAILFFCQCKTSQLSRIENLVKKSTAIKFLNKQEFDQCRGLMLKTLSPSIMHNDTIIILEYFPDGTGSSYSCSIYESRNRTVSIYTTIKSMQKGEIHIDSLALLSNVKDYILPMVINNQLDEVKKRGDATTLTPASTLILNILSKDKAKNRFTIQTLNTQDFNAYPHYDIPEVSVKKNSKK